MMVGSTWNAKMKPLLLMSIRLPKMKLEPSLTKLSTLTKPWPSQSNTSRPPGTSSTSAANEICSARPVATSFQSIARRLFENSQVMPMAPPDRIGQSRSFPNLRPFHSPAQTANREA